MERQHDKEEHLLTNLVKEISLLTHEICKFREEKKNEFDWFKSHAEFATKQDLKETERKIMSQISDWKAVVVPKLDRVQTGLDTVQALVEKLQSTAGVLTPEDQAILDEIEAKVDAIATDADSVPPVPPV